MSLDQSGEPEAEVPGVDSNGAGSASSEAEPESGERALARHLGLRGDHAGARRARRSFRLCVLAVVVVTISLWFSERYLRYDQAESLYIGALTLEPESARVLLRQAVKLDEERRESPSLKYLAALAEREEDDLVLPTYDRAYRMDRENATLAIRYGNALFIKGRYGQAQDVYLEAEAHSPQNAALPAYLEAIAAACENPSPESLAESLAVCARVNSSAKPISLPRPWWADAALPPRGEWYAGLLRNIQDECCAPFYRFAALIAEKARAEASEEKAQYWDACLDTLQTMGRNLMMAEPRGITTALAGAQMQLAAVEQRGMLVDLREELDDAARLANRTRLAEQRERLKDAIGLLNDREKKRVQIIASNKGKYMAPLFLSGEGILIVVALYLLGLMLTRAFHIQRSFWSVPHTRLGYSVVLTGFCMLLLCLVGYGMIQHSPGMHTTAQQWLANLWWASLICLILFGLVYPFTVLPRPELVCGENGDVLPEKMKIMRRYRHLAAVALLRRYYGIVCGTMFVVIGIWAIAFRIVESLYPWQIRSLATGLMEEEARIVNQILASLL